MSTTVDPPSSHISARSTHTNSTNQENQSLNMVSHTFNAHPPRPSLSSAHTDVKKQLFQTPAPSTRKPKFLAHSPRTPAQKLSSPANSQPTSQSNKPLPQGFTTRSRPTSTAVTPSQSSVRRRPNYARISSTPALKRRYVATAPDMWRNQQKHDLTAWLNSELVDASLNGSYLAWQNITTSVVFLKQFLAMRQLYRSVQMQAILKKVDNEIAQRRFFISRSICLLNHVHPREDIVNLLLQNYHPIWLMLGLWVVLGFNFAPVLDEAIRRAHESGREDVDSESVLIEVLHHAISQCLLSKHHVICREKVLSSADKRKSMRSQSRDEYNGMILSRLLHLILLLDRAKQAAVPIVSTDPPLFRYNSEIGSSEEVIQYLGREFLKEQGDVVKFLQHREYRVHYEAPILERMGSLFVTDLSKDLIDGTRLCKLAAMLVRDKTILHMIRRVKSGMTKQKVHSCHIGNVGLALNRIHKYVAKHTTSSFEWEASHSDIVDGDIDKTIRVLWQIVSLWLEIIVLDRKLLEKELKAVQQQFREVSAERRNTLSPGSLEFSGDVSLRKISPSRIEIYETCDSVSSTLLLKWSATVTGIYGVSVRDFTESFRDGAALCLILHHYCPSLVQLEDITRVKLAELRSVNDSEAEAELAQQNFDLFTKQCRLLGNFPHIPISVQAALAPSFSSHEKEASFGRLMEILCAYLFKRLILEKERGSVELNAEHILNNQEVSTFNGELESIASSRRESGNSISETSSEKNRTALERVEGKLYETIAQQNHNGERARTTNALGTSDSSFMNHDSSYPDEQLGNSSLSDKEITGDAPSEISGGSNDKGDIAVKPDEIKEKAALTILQYYRARKRSQLFAMQRKHVVDIQNAFRRFQAQNYLQLLSQESSATPTSSLQTDMRSEEESITCKISPSQESEVRDSPTPTKSVPSHLASPSEVSNVLGTVHVALSSLGTHACAVENFVQRMLTHERNMAANILQKSLRTLAARNELNSRRQDAEEMEQRKSVFQTVLSSIPSAAASFTERVAKEVAKQKAAYIVLITSALQKAEQACSMELRKREEARDLETHRLRQDRRKQFEDAEAKQQMQEKISLEAGLEDLRREVTQLQKRLEHHDNIEIDGDGFHSPPPMGRYEDLQTSAEEEFLEIPENPSHEIEDPGLVVGDHIRREDLEHLRHSENETLADLINFHKDWDEDLAKREASLRERESSYVESLLDLAGRAFELHMTEVEQHRKEFLEKEQRHRELGEGLREEDQKASAEKALIESETIDNISGLVSRVSELEEEVDRDVGLVELRCQNFEEQLEELHLVRVASEKFEAEWNVDTKSFDVEALETGEMLSSFVDWKQTADDDLNEKGNSTCSPGEAEMGAQIVEQSIPVEVRTLSTDIETPVQELPRTPEMPDSNDAADAQVSPEQENLEVPKPEWNESASQMSSDMTNVVTASDDLVKPSSQPQSPDDREVVSRSNTQDSDTTHRESKQIFPANSSPLPIPSIPSAEKYSPQRIGVLASIENHFKSPRSTPRSQNDITKSDAYETPSETHSENVHKISKSDTDSIAASYRRFLRSPGQPIRIGAEPALLHSTGKTSNSRAFSFTPEASTLDQLSQELTDLNLDTPSIDKVQEVLRSPALSQRLGSALRRLSSALASPAPLARLSVSSALVSPAPFGRLSGTEDLEQTAWEINLIRTIFIIIQQCTRTKTHLALVESGISLIKEFATDEERIDHIVCAEDSLEVLVTCIQFYRDHETVLSHALEAFIALSWHPLIAADLRADDGFKRRLLATYDLMKLEAGRIIRHKERLRRTEIIMNALNQSKQCPSQSMSVLLQAEEKNSSETQPEVYGHSLALFEKLFSRFIDRQKPASEVHLRSNQKTSIIPPLFLK